MPATLEEVLGGYRDDPVSKGCTSPFAPIWINQLVRRQEDDQSTGRQRRAEENPIASSVAPRARYA